jgi:hypothetical protein
MPEEENTSAPAAEILPFAGGGTGGVAPVPGDDAAGRPSETADTSHDAISAFVESVVEDAEDLCSKHDHITRVLADIGFPVEELTDRHNDNDTPFTFPSVIHLFLYQKIHQYSYERPLVVCGTGRIS